MSTTESVLVAMTDLVCCIVHRNFKGTCVHYDVTTFCDVSKTANRLQLLSFTSTLRSGDMDGCMYVVVDSEYHHHHMVAHFLPYCTNYSNGRSSFLNIIGNIDRNVLTRSDFQVMKTLL